MYIVGVVVALAIWIVKVVFAFVQLNSIKQRNLNKIGQRLSWITLSAKPLKKGDLDAGLAYKLLKFSIIWLVVPFFLIFTSWVYVLVSLVGVLYVLYRNIGKPATIKEFQWRLSNMDLSFDQIVEGLVQSSGTNILNIDDAKDQIRKNMKDEGLI